MLTQIDRENFQSRGLIRCENFLPAAKVTLAREAILQHLEQAGIRHGDSWDLGKCDPTALAQIGKGLTKAFKRHQRLNDLIADEIPQVVVELLDGRSTFPLAEYPGLLFTLPNAASWTLPHDNWHLDLPRLGDGKIPGVQIFTFLERVVPGGGGTLVVAGSHRLLNERKRISSQQLKQRLKQEPYFQKLMAPESADRHRFLEEVGQVGGVKLQVVELYGEPGDVYFMDLRLLHTTAPNAAAIPRIMLTQRYLLEAARHRL